MLAVKIKVFLELAVAHNLGQASLAVAIASAPVAGASSAFFGGVSSSPFAFDKENFSRPCFPA